MQCKLNLIPFPQKTFLVIRILMSIMTFSFDDPNILFCVFYFKTSSIHPLEPHFQVSPYIFYDMDILWRHEPLF